MITKVMPRVESKSRTQTEIVNGKAVVTTHNKTYLSVYSNESSTVIAYEVFSFRTKACQDLFTMKVTEFINDNFVQGQSTIDIGDFSINIYSGRQEKKVSLDIREIYQSDRVSNAEQQTQQA